ncbi:MAG: outer membrane protein assembly factor BamA [Geobacter sp.]|nr:outer membrane protein assembly factor BamA [Geobacter sp.]
MARGAFLTNILVIFTFVLLSVLPAVAAQDQIAEMIISGNRRIETAAIMNAVKSKAGEKLIEEKIDADVKAIFGLGYFTDIKAQKSVRDKGIVITFIVTEKPVIRDIIFSGNSEISTDKLKENFELKPNSIYTSKEVVKNIKKLKKLYSDEGYPLAEIEPVKESINQYDVKLTLKIKEGAKILIREIVFEGNSAFNPSTLKGIMETKQDWWLAWLTGAGVYKEDVLKNDVLLLTEHYMNNGYINFKISEPKVEMTADKKAMTVAISLSEGDKYSVGLLDFKGDLLETKEELAKKLKMKSGEVFNRAQLRQEIASFTDLYADKGYAFANVNPLTALNNQKKIIDIMFDIEKGEKVYIDRINITGNGKTRDKVIRREMRISEGELYSATGLKKSKQNIMNLGYFEEATVATSKGKGDNKLNLDVTVKEKPTGTFSIGGGYSSLDGFVAQGSIQQSNLFGMGLKANLSASLGGKSSTYSLGVTDPYFLDTKVSLGGDVYRTERQYVDYTKLAYGGDVKAGYQISDTLNTFLMYKLEQTTLLKESFALQRTRDLFPELVTTANTTTSSLTASISRNATDYKIDPSSGMTNSLSVEYAGLGGTTKFVRSIAKTAQFFPVGFGTVFMLQGTLGYIQDAGAKIPLDEKFYLGGINTLRGYGSRTVSPFKTTDQNDGATNEITGSQRVYLGGDTEAVFNAEYTLPLIKEAGLKGVLFFDAGNAVDGINNAFSTLRTSYGFGIRWFSPIGPLRLEYGMPLNPRKGIDSSSRLEFSIGNFF